jgi:hypothetical protein
MFENYFHYFMIVSNIFSRKWVVEIIFISLRKDLEIVLGGELVG